MRPSLVHGLVEVPRMAGEVGEYAASRRILRKARHGDGQHVLVLPGLMAGDYTTAIMRSYLSSLGYHPHGWGVGRNIGPTRLIVDSMRASVENLTAEHGPISLIGWSLGGLYARQLGRAYPDQVRQVITLGSPFRLIHREDTLASLVFDRYRHLHVEAEELDMPEQEHLRDPMPIPTTAIYSRTDGIVPWQACLNEIYGKAENIEVKASHIGMGHHPAVLWAIADRLALPMDQWRPFKVPGSLRRWYPTPLSWPLDDEFLIDVIEPDLGGPVNEAATG
ncbi:MAG: alpha/beta hydrolase [Actinobacteria bacterium]|nr:alpha/beta hydrolase [Actinomycetota bacterium]